MADGSEEGLNVKRLLREEISAMWMSLPLSERRVAEQIIATYPDVAFETVQSLGAAADTSPRTALRLVRRLGYAGFPALQAVIRRDIAARLSSPAARLRSARPGLAEALYDDYAVKNIAALADHLEDLKALAGRLASRRGRVFVHGAGKSLALATYLSHGLALIESGSALLRGSAVELVQGCLDIGRSDTLIVCEFRRYPQSALWIANTAQQAGAHVIAVSDSDVAPAAVVADEVFAVSTSTDSILDSYVAAFMLVELLLGFTTKSLPKAELEGRLARFDVLAAEVGAFAG